MKNNAIFRCDGAAHIGLGHVMRCLALADGLRRNGYSNITFVSKDYDNKVLAKIRSHDFKVDEIPRHADLREDLGRVMGLVRDNNGAIVITDSYEIDFHYLRELKNRNVFLICIDDLARIHFPSDVVLNQNLYALEENYSVEPYTKLLLGPQYALLRREFSERCVALPSVREKVKSILVTMGGSDLYRQTSKVVSALSGINSLIRDKVMVQVVVGIGHNHSQLSFFDGGENCQLKVVTGPDNLLQLMTEADLAICAGGSTCYELACLGIPAITMSLADNQRKIAERLSKEEVSVYLGYYQEVSAEDITHAVELLMENYEKRRKMSAQGRNLVDGQGVGRVVKEITQLLCSYQ